MAHYFMWTQGCQMNQADSTRLGSYLGQWGFRSAPREEGAQVVVVNTCVVRQRTEERALAKLASLGTWKECHPQGALVVTGCMVDSQMEKLKKKFPYVDLFFRPQDFTPFLEWGKGYDGAPLPPSPPPPSCYVPIIQGCDYFCTYCIVPFRRGRERSRPLAEIVVEVEELVKQGVREVVLLGQNVNAYGHNPPGSPNLGELLAQLNRIPGLLRIRFLTSHPRDITPSFIQTLASLEKVGPSLSLPVQAGDDGILGMMGRGYTVEEYRQLIGQLRQAMPSIAISTDVIVGFPGEREREFEAMVRLVEELRFDTVHIATYSPRPGTWAARHLKDEVSSQEKKARQRRLEQLQAAIGWEKHSRLLGSEVEVLVEGKAKGRWQGRTRAGKLVFFDEGRDWRGRLALVKVEQASPWWLEGRLLRCLV